MHRSPSLLAFALASILGCGPPALTHLEADLYILPPAVDQPLESRYPGATFENATEVIKEEGTQRTKTYIVVVKTADKKTLEVELDDKGKILSEDE